MNKQYSLNMLIKSKYTSYSKSSLGVQKLLVTNTLFMWMTRRPTELKIFHL